MFVTFINGVPATDIPEGAQEVNIANQAQKNQASLTPTEKSVSNKMNIVDTLFSTPEEDNKKMDKMLFDKIAEKVIERQNKKTINENIEFDSNAFKPTDSERATFSDAADYRLTDGMDNFLLSGSMNEAAAPVIPEMPVGPDTMPDMTMAAPEMPMAMAKGGLVARRKK
jgi:hypothetical protein